MMSQDEAKAKWCPFARSGGWAHEPAINRTLIGDATKACQCIASACMAWRWVENYGPGGYCGLAGKPE